MGLMTEPAWESNPGPLSSTDYHQENLRHLKKLQVEYCRNFSRLFRLSLILKYSNHLNTEHLNTGFI